VDSQSSLDLAAGTVVDVGQDLVVSVGVSAKTSGGRGAGIVSIGTDSDLPEYREIPLRLDAEFRNQFCFYPSRQRMLSERLDYNTPLHLEVLRNPRTVDSIGDTYQKLRQDK